MSRRAAQDSAAITGPATLSRRKALAVGGLGVASALAAGWAPSAEAPDGKLSKEVENLGMPWEDQYAMPRP